MRETGLFAHARDVNGRPLWLDLAAAPNIQLAGCTDQVTSVAMNAMIASLMLLKGQEEVKFVSIDTNIDHFMDWNLMDKYVIKFATKAFLDSPTKFQFSILPECHVRPLHPKSLFRF